MRQLVAFIKKEFTEQLRTGRLLLLCILFFLFGIMNPAIAKLIPALMELMSDSLAETGMIVTEVEVDALTSWTQFFKNLPMMLVIFLILYAPILSAECTKGTLINMVTKGLRRPWILLSKLILMDTLWTVGYFLCFALTYGYNSLYWDNGVTEHLVFPVLCLWLMGLWLISVIPLASAVTDSIPAILVCVGGVWLAAMLIGMLKGVGELSPIRLSEVSALLWQGSQMSDYLLCIPVTVLLIILHTGLAIILFRRKAI
ncbi:MAG: ABC transporter permease subunit [Eubacteriales bacterium]